MSRKKTSAEYSKADMQVAVQNLIAKGLVVAREVNGKVRYFAAEYAPPPGLPELDSSQSRPGKDSYLGSSSIIRRF
ncbi:hypothetical protein ACVJGD_004625 [Bradyrhizobium sp. USDA 10063]